MSSVIATNPPSERGNRYDAVTNTARRLGLSLVIFWTRWVIVWNTLHRSCAQETRMTETVILEGASEEAGLGVAPRSAPQPDGSWISATLAWTSALFRRTLPENHHLPSLGRLHPAGGQVSGLAGVDFGETRRHQRDKTPRWCRREHATTGDDQTPGPRPVTLSSEGGVRTRWRRASLNSF